MWKTLKYHGETYFRFEVSDKGKLRNARTHKEYSLNNKNSGGYIIINVSNGSRDDKMTIRLHRAVAETFIPNPDNLPHVNHKDCNKLNNDISNLEWCTPQYNYHHAYSNKLIRETIINTQKKLNEEQVKFFREHYIPRDKEWGCRPMARRYNIDRDVLKDILSYKTYKWVE